MVEESKENLKENQEKFKNFGFDLYPDRRSVDNETYTNNDLALNKKVRNHCTKVCEKNVMLAIKKNPIVKLLLGSLKNAGCPINIKRHIVCEECNSVVTGGYDQELNQIVVCDNLSEGRKAPDVTLIHELIHMYDYCVGKIDFKNLEHLACTEIRAANLSHCSFISSLLISQSSIFNIKKTHQCNAKSTSLFNEFQYCVKMKAAQSMVLSRNIDFETAMKSILKVFNKCYNDLEPIGRRIQRNSQDPLLALNENDKEDSFQKKIKLKKLF